MADLFQFSKNIRKRGRQVENSGSEIVRSMAKKALRSLIHSTKADTGRARSNWRVGLGAAPTTVIAPYAPYPKGSKANGRGISETANATAAISAGIARINSVKGVSGVGLKTAIYITNSISYLDKALVPGAVEVSVREAQVALRGFRIFDRNSGGDE